MSKKSSGKEQKSSADRKNLSLSLSNAPASNSNGPNQISSPVGEGLVGLRWIDDAGSEENLLDSRMGRPSKKRTPEDEAEQVHLLTAADVAPVTEQPCSGPPPCQVYSPPGLAPLLETGQVVVHLDNLRKNLTINKEPVTRMEVVDETRKVLFHVEQLDDDLESKTSFEFKLYDDQSQEVIRVFSPTNSTCICCGASWHCMKRCRFQAIIYTPLGVVAGFVRRSRTKFVQEFEILDSNEQRVLALRGSPEDLVIHSADFHDDLGRLSVHGWVGIMHEMRRTSRDYGLTFPIDLDVRVKAVLVGAVFAIHWLYTSKGGKKALQKKTTSSPKKKDKEKNTSAENDTTDKNAVTT